MDAVSKIRRVMLREICNVSEEIKKDRVIYIYIFVFLIASSFFVYNYGYSNKIRFFAYFYILKYIVPISIMVLSILYYFKLLLRMEPHPIRRFNQKFLLVLNNRTRLISSFILLTANSIFISNFSTLKSMIPIVNMFKYDNLFYQIDKYIFMGNEPGLLFHYLIESPYFYFFINFCYNLWFFLMWSVVCYFLLTNDSINRVRFFISWLLCWSLLGILLATLLSSVGPAFLPRLNPNNQTYDLLLQTLDSKHNWLIMQEWPGLFSLNIQDILWDAYINSKDTLGSGISAMPSMHVSIAVLLALSIYNVNKTLGALFWIFSIIIFIGSFTLGWHYFIDGLVSIPLTIAIWCSSSYFVDCENKILCTSKNV